MPPLLIIACCARKAAIASGTPTELYTGHLFRNAVKWATRNGVGWVVLSARYGIVLPTDVIDNYDQRMTTKGADAFQRTLDWPAAWYGWRLCSPTYSRAIPPAIRDARFPHLCPGLRIGEQMHWLIHHALP